MAGAGRTLVWWDRDVDQSGRPIRPDVRLAGHEIWEQACKRTRAILDDHGPAAELMENSVAQVSRYLDRIGAPHSSRKHGLLMVAYCRRLRRYAVKASRLQLMGEDSEFSNRTASNGWIRQVDARLDLQNIVRRLSKRNGMVLTLKSAEYEWKEIAAIFGMSVAALRNGFWRDVEKIRWDLRRELPGAGRLERPSRPDRE